MRPDLTLKLAGSALLVLAVLVVGLGLVEPDYSVVDQPVDLLALGRFGVVLGIGSVLTGLLVVLAAPTLGRVLDPERGRRAVPVLLTLFGASLVVSGVASPDEAFGFPAGAPDGPVSDPTGAGATHALAALLAATLLPAAVLVQAARWRRDDATRRSALVAFVVAVVTLWASLAYSASISGDGDLSGLWQRIAMVTGWGWLAVQLLGVRSGSAGTRR